VEYRKPLGMILTGAGILLYAIPLTYGFFKGSLGTDSIYGKGFYVSLIPVLIGPALWFGEVPEAIVKAVRAKILGVRGGSA
jgi:hypothetical protein